MNKKKINLNEIKSIEKGILDHFCEFCDKNSITYFLSNGTLLGAIKYKGFIPWDDDIDVFIPREDYDRFIKLYQDTERYKLYEISKNKKYILPFAKMCDITTCKVEYDYDNGIEMGLDIDIFPLDFWHSSYKSAKRQCRVQMLYMVLFDVARRIKPPKTFSQAPIKFFVYKFCKGLGPRFFAKRMIKSAKKAGLKNKKCAYSGCIVWPVYGFKEMIPSCVFEEKINAVFENRLYTIPKQYDIYLNSLYGDYRQDPPAEKQKTHHRFQADFID